MQTKYEAAISKETSSFPTHKHSFLSTQQNNNNNKCYGLISAVIHCRWVCSLGILCDSVTSLYGKFNCCPKRALKRFAIRVMLKSIRATSTRTGRTFQNRREMYVSKSQLMRRRRRSAILSRATKNSSAHTKYYTCQRALV